MEKPRHIEILENIVERPSMYWGDSANHFHSFIGFLTGYGWRLEFTDEHPCLIPDDFHYFVTHHYVGEWRLEGTKGWMTFIEENTSDDHAALRKLLELRTEYDQSDHSYQKG